MINKIAVNTKIQTIVDVESDFSDQTIPAGTMGTVVECYENPTGYAVDLAIPNHDLVGGYYYENVILMPAQFFAMSDSPLAYQVNGTADYQKKRQLETVMV
ncbi:MAG: hypothetical protein ACPGWR_21305 [Ardenticatenaceae bacterium]